MNIIEGQQVIDDSCDICLIVLNDKILYFIIVVVFYVVVCVIKVCEEGEIEVCVL